MGLEHVALLAFNRGRISRLALARTDIKRVAMSADDPHVNWTPRVMGPMSLRVGLGYLGSTIPAKPRFIPFVFATADRSLIEFTDSMMRVWVNDTPITRVQVSEQLANTDFAANINNWTDSSEAGGSVAWVAPSYAGVTGNGTAAGQLDQTVFVPAGDQAKEHALRITVQRGPVICRIGTTAGADDLMPEALLDTGVHSLAFTPNSANFTVRFRNPLKRQVLVDSCALEQAGILSLPSPFLAADLAKIRFDQSANVVFLACPTYQQRTVERRSATSYSLVRYRPTDGPLRTGNSGAITFTPSALSGNITVTASAGFFRPTHGPSANNDGALFRITSNGQSVSAVVVAQNQFTNTIKVTGVADQRTFTVTLVNLTGTGSTVTIQRSLVGPTGPWTDVKTWVADVVEVFPDGLDNQIAWYQIGVKTGGYAGGNITCKLDYTVGSIDGFVRVTGYTSNTVVSAEVITDLGGTAATNDWAEGDWSDYRGYPTALRLWEGRLYNFGKHGVWGTISDDFYSYDESVEGDSGTINRDAGAGAVDNINWGLALARLILGADGAELSCKTSALDEPLTPTNFAIKPDSRQGSAAIEAWAIDKDGVFVQNGGTRVFRLSRPQGIDYDADDITKLIPEICAVGIARSAVQRKPDTRMHYILNDGTVALAVIDRVEDVLCWCNITIRAGDVIEDVVVVPGDLGSGEDAVYYATARQINGATVRFLERWALESDCVGGVLNKQADAYVTYNQAAAQQIGPFPHLIGAAVVVWDNGKCMRDAANEIQSFVVDANGYVQLTNAGVAYQGTQGVVGLSYLAQWKSTKLAYAAQDGSALNQRKNYEHLGVILDRTHHRGLKYGPSFTELQPLPEVEDEQITPEDTIYSNYDKDPFEFPGEWGPDSRLCLQAQAPRPCTVMAATLPIEEHSK